MDLLTKEGEWLDNLRHGNGKHTCDFYEYVGQWHSGVRHGRGRLIRKNPDGPDQQPIFGPFENDMPNGLFAHGGKTVMHKQGMEVELSGNEFTCQKAAYVLCQILAMVAMGVVITIAIKEPIPPFFIGLAMIYLIYQTVACTSDARKYLSNTIL